MPLKTSRHARRLDYLELSLVLPSKCRVSLLACPLAGGFQLIVVFEKRRPGAKPQWVSGQL